MGDDGARYLQQAIEQRDEARRRVRTLQLELSIRKRMYALDLEYIVIARRIVAMLAHRKRDSARRLSKALDPYHEGQRNEAHDAYHDARCILRGFGP